MSAADLGYPQPSNVEAEQALLGALLVRNDTLFAMPQIREDSFFEPLHGRIFKAICDTVERGLVANPVTLRTLFDQDDALRDLGGGSYLAKLVSFSIIVYNIEDYVRVILDCAQRRQIIQSCHDTIMAATNLTNNLTAADIASQLALEADRASESVTRFRVMTDRQMSERIYEKMKNRLFATPVSTGLHALDDSMGGGMFPGKMYGLMGRKKHGKTMLAGTISNHLQAAEVKHVFLALEMGGEEIHQRALAAAIGCYESAFRTGFGETDSFLQGLADYVIGSKSARMYVDAPGLRFADLRALLPSMIRKHGLSGFVLDSWQLVKGKKDRQSEVDHLDEVAQWLAETCKKYGVWGLVTAQENQGENTRGGEGLRLACDQCYRVGKKDASSAFAWLDMMETRYTEWKGVGSKDSPGLCLSEKFTHFEEVKSSILPPVTAGHYQETLIPD